MRSITSAAGARVRRRGAKWPSIALSVQLCRIPAEIDDRDLPPSVSVQFSSPPDAASQVVYKTAALPAEPHRRFPSSPRMRQFMTLTWTSSRAPTRRITVAHGHPGRSQLGPASCARPRDCLLWLSWLAVVIPAIALRSRERMAPSSARFDQMRRDGALWPRNTAVPEGWKQHAFGRLERAGIGPGSAETEYPPGSVAQNGSSSE
jgi:hypothetical protein